MLAQKLQQLLDKHGQQMSAHAHVELSNCALEIHNELTKDEPNKDDDDDESVCGENGPEDEEETEEEALVNCQDPNAVSESARELFFQGREAKLPAGTNIWWASPEARILMAAEPELNAVQTAELRRDVCRRDTHRADGMHPAVGPC